MNAFGPRPPTTRPSVVLYMCAKVTLRGCLGLAVHPSSFRCGPGCCPEAGVATNPSARERVAEVIVPLTRAGDESSSLRILENGPMCVLDVG